MFQGSPQVHSHPVFSQGRQVSWSPEVRGHSLSLTTPGRGSCLSSLMFGAELCPGGINLAWDARPGYPGLLDQKARQRETIPENASMPNSRLSSRGALGFRRINELICALPWKACSLWPG